MVGLHYRSLPCEPPQYFMRLKMDEDAFFLENYYLKIFLMDSGRECWISQV
jgi:hypothetical protein